MKTRTINAVALAIVLVCVFTLSGFSQATDPPDKGKTSGEDQLITLTKKYYSKKNCIDLKVSPNPIRSSATIEFILDEAREIQIGIYNKKGEMVQDIVKQKFEEGKNQVTFTPTDLDTGVYYICVSCDKKRGMKRCNII